MSNNFYRPDYAGAMEDFHAARRKAVLGEVLARLRGKSSRMISYDEIRKRFGGLESARRQLKEIPLDAIVGTVGRYKDFSRTLLPLSANDGARWAGVRNAVDTQMGLPPIEVYQVGEVYFILDGHHRASVAREIGATHIQAYVRDVYTRVPLSPDDQPDDIILKSEYADFLQKTRLDDIRPGTDLKVTAPGEYDKLLEHISVHRYFQGIDENRPVAYDEAVSHWFDTVYIPIARLIQQRNILKDFPGRTETDLYLWIMDHRTSLQEGLGWQVSPTTAANDLFLRYSPRLYNILKRAVINFLRVITPDQLEPSPTPGVWREKHADVMGEPQGLFNNILVAVSGDTQGWQAVDQAIFIARNEKSVLGGLHINSRKDELQINGENLAQEFLEKCAKNGVVGSLAIESGNITHQIYGKSFWADLLVLRLSHPPPVMSFRRLFSGMRDLIRLCKMPLIVVPPTAVTELKRILLAYGGGHKADEALFVAAYLAKRWGVELVVVTVSRGKNTGDALADRARNYLDQQNVRSPRYIDETGDPAVAILKHCANEGCDLILMGGYEGGFIREIIFGSTVDRVLWGTRRSVMICN
jgi:nucleotide-binding universal stress UspA family protein